MSFNTIYQQIQNLVSDNTANSLTLIKQLVNQTQNTLLALRKDITETSITDTTVAAQQAYNLPYNYGKMFYLTITVGSIAYPVTPLEDDEMWRVINARSTVYTTDIPSFFYIFNDQVYIYPKPASTGNTITMYYHKITKDMTAADYTTGNVVSIANGATALVGSGTTWTSAMVGRFIRITSDGYWYEIAAVPSATTITLKKPYKGTTISAGTEAYTIGEMPIIPEAYHELLVWRPCGIYLQQRGDFQKADFYWQQYDGGYSTGKRAKQGAMLESFINDRSSKVESGIVNSKLKQMKQNAQILDPNAFPINLTS